MFAKSSIVEVGSDVALAFEARAKLPDERDPGIYITREGADTGADKGGDTRGQAARPRPALKRRPAGGARPAFEVRRGPKSFKPGRAKREERPGARSAGVPGARPAGPRAHAGSAEPAESGDRKPAPRHARKTGPKAPFSKPFKPGAARSAGPPKARRKAEPGGPPSRPKR